MTESFINGLSRLPNLKVIARNTVFRYKNKNADAQEVGETLGRNDELARGAIRFSFGKENSVEDIQYLLEILPKAVENLRKLSPQFLQKSIK